MWPRNVQKERMPGIVSRLRYLSQYFSVSKTVSKLTGSATLI